MGGPAESGALDRDTACTFVATAVRGLNEVNAVDLIARLHITHAIAVETDWMVNQLTQLGFVRRLFKLYDYSRVEPLPHPVRPDPAMVAGDVIAIAVAAGGPIIVDDIVQSLRNERGIGVTPDWVTKRLRFGHGLVKRRGADGSLAWHHPDPAEPHYLEQVPA